jgi:hypothetical protein
MSGQIFIGRRRKESRWSARILRDRLFRDFDPQQIFMRSEGNGLPQTRLCFRDGLALQHQRELRS